MKLKCTIIIDKDREEELTIIAHEKNKLVEEIERLMESSSLEIIGYANENIKKLTPMEIYCFNIENGKIVAYTEFEKFFVKKRIYELEELLSCDFVKINQSCIVNIKKISHFSASFGGALMITLKNGYRDYVSRRQVKAVKERVGI